MLVTFAMPDLTVAHVRCPASAWLNGEHLHIPTMLARFVAPPSVPKTEYGEHAYDRFDT